MFHSAFLLMFTRATVHDTEQRGHTKLLWAIVTHSPKYGWQVEGGDNENDPEIAEIK